MRISIGSDHRGIQIKSKLISCLQANGHQVFDVGTQGDSSVDYPNFATLVCGDICAGRCDRGILICGTGIGMAIAANKFAGVRAANCCDEVMAEMCRRHNNVNVLCLPGDLIGDRPVDDLVLTWLAAEFEGGRHQRRIEQIEAIERSQNTKPAGDH
ncbi:MAG: ribose 5-phosphate isomerase B [Planctomycetales bacterium]|nr:ribose 5-phosphate isomerase B [Planctomycetales bacterium]